MSDLTVVPYATAANVVRIADFVEIECLRRADGSVSSLDMSRIMGRGDESSDDDISNIVLDAFSDLADRVVHCGNEVGRYPFKVADAGGLLTVRDWESDEDRRSSMIYFFLLLATRLNMKTSRKHGGEDATKIFEHLCSEVAIRYWGGPHEKVRAIVFGTGQDKEELDDGDELDLGKFGKAVSELCSALREGEEFHPKSAGKVTAVDGKLDIVVWRQFADQRHGQLIGFGQCKTGTHWDRDLHKLQPVGFCQKWMRSMPATQPLRLYFVCDRILDRWYDNCSDGGIVFDRCRVMEFTNELPDKLLGRIGKWVAAAMKSEGLVIP